jgi:prolyl-tRNA synthetase
VNWSDEQSRVTAEGIYTQLLTAGVDTLLDDRDERPGVKFKDADLLGTPLRVTIGAKSLARGMVELKRRTEKQGTEVGVDQIVETLVSLSREHT